MLGYFLARAGVPVVVLEKHADFFRDFRGDTIHPSTLQMMRRAGCARRIPEAPASGNAPRQRQIGGRQFYMADFSHLPTACKYIAFMPQWDFLNFLAEQGKRFPTFDLRMGADATG